LRRAILDLGVESTSLRSHAEELSVKRLTIRELPAEVAEAPERQRSGSSLRQTCIDLLHRALGVPQPLARSNGLASLAGTWSQTEQERFTAAITSTEQIDEELWR
jgi:hypothetical protein